MNWPQLAISDYIALTALLGAAMGVIFRTIHKMRTNDLLHLDEKIDLHHTTMMTTVDRIEGKIDEHVRDHATGLFI